MNDTLAPDDDSSPMTDHDAPDPGAATTPPTDPRSSSPGAGYQQPPAPQRRLRRSARGPFGGVANGIAEFLGVDAILVQAAFVALTVFGGSGVLLYLAGWFLIPDHTSTDPRPVAVSNKALNVIIGVLFATGAASLVFGSITLGFSGNFIAALALVGLGVFLLNQRPEANSSGSVVAAPASMAAPTSSTTAPAPSMWAPPTPPPPAPSDAHWAMTQVHDEVLGSPPPVEPGPPVTSVTLALSALVVGVLLTIDQLTGADISASVMIGAALAVMGGGLVVSAFVGRALALIPIGIVTALCLLVAPILDLTIDGGSGSREVVETDVANLQTDYVLGAGALELDFTGLEIIEDTTVNVAVGAGYTEIWVPDDVNVKVIASSDFGYVEVFRRESAGVGAERTSTVAPRGDIDPSTAPTLTVTADVRFGYVEVNR